MHDVLGPPLLIFWQILATVIMLNMRTSEQREAFGVLIFTYFIPFRPQ